MNSSVVSGFTIILLLLFDLSIFVIVLAVEEKFMVIEEVFNGGSQTRQIVDEQEEDDQAVDTRRQLPDFWEPENNPEIIRQKRQKLLEESLGKEKFSKMRKRMEALREKEKSRNVEKLPDNEMLEINLMEQVNQFGREETEDESSANFMPSENVPSLHRVNKPIGDLLFHGDMLLSEDQADDLLGEEGDSPESNGNRRRRKRQLLEGRMFPLNQWATSQPICYTFDGSISDNTRKLVRQAAQFWQDHSCVSMQENCAQSPRVHVFKGQGCYSEVGRDIFTRSQDMSLGTGCELFGTVTHEFGHILGLFHHHSRSDRDDFIKVVETNIEPNWRIQYAKVSKEKADNLGLPYNYASNMHYGGSDANSEKIIMAAKHKRFQHTMGNNMGPVFLDLLAVNKYYHCLNKCPSGADCKNEGFRNSRDCQKCICPEGFGGDDCSQRAPGANGAPENCGQTISAQSSPASLSGEVKADVQAGRLLSDRQASCHFHIQAPAGQRVQIEMSAVTGTCTPECYFGAVEIKLGDFTKGGIRVCCEKHLAEIGDKLVSDGQLAIVSLYSQKGTTSFSLKYKATTDAATKDDDLLGSNASSVGPSPFANLLAELISNKQKNGGQQQQQEGNNGNKEGVVCEDKNKICVSKMGSLICSMPFYQNMRQMVCQKSCNLC